MNIDNAKVIFQAGPEHGDNGKTGRIKHVAYTTNGFAFLVETPEKTYKTWLAHYCARVYE